jgi:hypothetical protein
MRLRAGRYHLLAGRFERITFKKNCSGVTAGSAEATFGKVQRY